MFIWMWSFPVVVPRHRLSLQSTPTSSDKPNQYWTWLNARSHIQGVAYLPEHLRTHTHTHAHILSPVYVFQLAPNPHECTETLSTYCMCYLMFYLRLQFKMLVTHLQLIEGVTRQTCALWYSCNTLIRNWKIFSIDRVSNYFRLSS